MNGVGDCGKLERVLVMGGGAHRDRAGGGENAEEIVTTRDDDQWESANPGASRRLESIPGRLQLALEDVPVFL